MTLEEYANQVKQEILADSSADDNQGFAEDKFTEYWLDRLKDGDEIDDPIICNCRKRGIKLNAYSASPDEDYVDLVVSHYTASVPPVTVTKTIVDNHFHWLLGFLTKSIGGKFHPRLEEASPEFDAASQLNTLKESITTVRCFLLTDGIAKIEHLEEEKADGFRIIYNVWDIQRLFRLETSGRGRESITIDFQKQYQQAVPCLDNEQGEEYRCFIGFFPATLLVKIYSDYGPRLLERNVRSFLQARGKVNKGIRETILNEPGRFLAYNNGISATAEDMEYTRVSNSICLINKISGFQIVNGAQTTASLYHAFRKDDADLSDVNVQVKVTLINKAENIDTIAPKISLYANSQNKINAADFSANDPYHRRIEELSRSVWAPATHGQQNQTHWYYERARGQYLDDKNREGTQAKKRQFEILNPTPQKFTKTDLAKYIHSWKEQLPYIVSRGAEKNFAEFTLRQQKAGQAKPDEQYYKDLIAQAILFKRTEKIVHSENFGGYRANIVTYTLSLLSHQTSQAVDLEKIWKEQDLYPELEDVVKSISRNAFKHITNTQGNVTEWCKKEECWQSFVESKKDLPRKFVNTLRSFEKNAKVKESPDAYGEDRCEEIEQVMLVKADVWFQISGWAKQTKNLMPYQRGIAYSLGRLIANGNTPTGKQAVQGVKLLEEARRLGFQPDTDDESE